MDDGWQSSRGAARRRRHGEGPVEHQLIPRGGTAAQWLRARAEQRVRACLRVVSLIVERETEIHRVTCQKAHLSPRARYIRAAERTQLTARVCILHELGQRTGQCREFA